MNGIESLNLYRLRNSEHFQFMTDLDILILKYVAVELGIDDLYTAFKQYLTAEDTALRVETSSAYSDLLRDLDDLRDETWNAIETRIASALICPFEDEVASARELQRIFDLYGDIRSLPYNEESGDMTNLVTDLLKPSNVVHLEKVCVKKWAEELKKENDNFQVTFNDRNAELAKRANGDVRAARRVIDPVYQEMVKRINASFVMKLAKPVATQFTNELNERISYYRNTLTARISRNRGKNKPPQK